MGIALSIILTAILILLNGFFSGSEMALVSARRTRLETELEEEPDDSKKARQVLKLQEDENSFLSTIQVGITLVGFGASAAAAATLAEPVGNWLSSFGITWLVHASGALSVVFVTLVVSYFTLVLGELVPKRIALSNPEGTAKNVSGIITKFQFFIKPVVAFLNISTNAITRLLRLPSSEDRNDVSEEEIKFMVAGQDTLRDEEKRMIHEIFDLGDSKAREVMVPRMDVTGIEDNLTIGEALEVMRLTGFSRLPVYQEEIDRILGIIHIKEIIGPIVAGESNKPVADFTREAMFVPDTKDIIPLLSEMQTSHEQMAIIVDEYGGTAGVVTVEDILEEIVGEIEDEFDPDNKYLTKLSDVEWLVDGRFPIDDAMDLEWPIDDSDEYETVAGWLLDMYDSVPVVGETITRGEYTFKVQSMRGRRIALIRVHHTPETPVQDEENLFED